MRVKTSVTLPSALLDQIDRHNSKRSAFLELAATQNLRQQTRQHRNSKEAAILAKHTELLNREAADVLDYQVFLEVGISDEGPHGISG